MRSAIWSRPAAAALWSHLAAAAIVVALPGPAGAEELAISADRPGYSDSTAIVPQFHLNAEAGVAETFGKEGLSADFPELLLRLGLLEWLEARLVAPNFMVVSPRRGESQSGFGDMGVGVKLAHSFSDRFSMSLVPQVSFPTGNEELTSEGVDPAAGLNYAVALTEALALAGNVAFAYGTQAGTYELSGSVSAGYGFTDEFGAYAEFILIYPEGDDLVPAVGGGYTWLLAPRVQVDASFDVGLTEGFDPTFGAGVAVLW
jgi:hypothetical protein